MTLENPYGGYIVQGQSHGVIVNDDCAYEIASAGASTQDEGQQGDITTFNFDVWRTGASSTSSSVSWRVVGTGENHVDGDDFVGGELPSGTLDFAAGETSQTLSIDIAGDYNIESQETFRVELFDPAENSTIALNGSSALATVDNDDVGTAENDILIGTGGPDEIRGLGGNDTLTGGVGPDRFVYTSPADGVDTITDFATGTDQIILSSGSFGTLGTGKETVVVSQEFDTDVDTTLGQLSAQNDADFYKVDFESGFTYGTGDEGHLDELEAAFTNGEHSGSAIIAVSNGDGNTRVYYDEDTSTGTDGSGLQEIVEVENVDDATTLADNSVEAQVV